MLEQDGERRRPGATLSCRERRRRGAGRRAGCEQLQGHDVLEQDGGRGGWVQDLKGASPRLNGTAGAAAGCHTRLARPTRGQHKAAQACNWEETSGGGFACCRLKHPGALHCQVSFLRLAKLLAGRAFLSRHLMQCGDAGRWQRIESGR